MRNTLGKSWATGQESDLGSECATLWERDGMPVSEKGLWHRKAFAMFFANFRGLVAPKCKFLNGFGRFWKASRGTWQVLEGFGSKLLWRHLLIKVLQKELRTPRTGPC